MRSKTAFTLVEMLVIISIIAILVAMMMPALEKALSASRTTACQNTVRGLGVAGMQYIDDNHGWLPSWGGNWNPWWGQLISPYLFPGYTAGSIPNIENSPLKCPLNGKVLKDNGVLFKHSYNYHMLFSNTRQRSMKSPANTVWFYDAQSFGYPFPAQGQSFTYAPNQSNRAGHWRHSGLLSMVMLDGHTEMMPDFGSGAEVKAAGYVINK